MMFKFLDVKEQLRIERQKNKVLQAHVKELEDAVVELADIITEKEEEEPDNG
jgi:hypothetical protein